MQYRYAQGGSYEDFAAGRVILHRSGYAHFPARLAQEVFMRCLAYLPKARDVTLLDPCCGGGYLLTVLGFMNGEKIARIIGSDVDERAVALARDNLGLLTGEGLLYRTKRIEEMYAEDARQSHLDALKSAQRLSKLLCSPPPLAEVFAADALEEETWSGRDLMADVAIADVPYGKLTSWKGTGDAGSLLKAIEPSLARHAVVAICAEKRDTVRAEGFVRCERQSVGKRQFEIFRRDTA